MRRVVVLGVLLALAMPAAVAAAEPPFREILFHAAAHERRALIRLHEEPPDLHNAKGDLEAGLRSLTWAQRLAREQLQSATARQVRHRLDDATNGDKRAIDALDRGRPGTAMLLIERALAEKETAAVLAAADDVKRGTPVRVDPPHCGAGAAPGTSCSATHFWTFNLPRGARAPQCHLLNAATGRGVGVVFNGVAERRTCTRRGASIRLTLVLTRRGGTAPPPKRVRAAVTWR